MIAFTLKINSAGRTQSGTVFVWHGTLRTFQSVGPIQEARPELPL